MTVTKEMNLDELAAMTVAQRRDFLSNAGFATSADGEPTKEFLVPVYLPFTGFVTMTWLDYGKRVVFTQEPVENSET